VACEACRFFKEHFQGSNNLIIIVLIFNKMKYKIKYNPKIHNRRSIRLKGYDYSQAGLYFVTICCENRKHRFGEVVAGTGIKPAQMILNEYGTVAYNEWIKLSERFSNLELDVFQIMPNHMHGIISIKSVPAAGFTPAPKPPNEYVPCVVPINGVPAGAGFTPAPIDPNTPIDENDRSTARVVPATPPPTLSDMVGAYKSLVANGCLDIYKSKNQTMGKLWQRNYHERIIRGEMGYHRVSNYIINNPKKWAADKLYTK
jgi:REP element-mobilizing transposase RayT